MHTELVAAVHAIRIADQLGIGCPIFVTDCLNLKNAPTSNDHDGSVIGPRLMHARFMLAWNFIEFKIEFSPRACNKPAHVLATLGVGYVHGNHSCGWRTFELM